MAKEKYFCEKCSTVKSETEFYGSNNKEKYPTGKLNICKDCITMHVDNTDPDTFLWILQECDVPWVPAEWYKLMKTYASENPEKMTSLSILGRYLAKMRLKQHKQFRWADTEKLQEIEDMKTKEVMSRQGYSAAEIEEAIQSNTVRLSAEQLQTPKQPDFSPSNPAAADNSFTLEDNTDDFVDDLTEEDKIYLKLKWGKMYRPDEWVRLEQFYNEMMNSYDVQGAGHIDTLKLICKTSLKANQLIDCGDVEGFQKMSKVYDNLMKSGNFTAAQAKAESGEFVDSIGELVAICEKEGFIPRYYVDEPQDKVDKTLLDLQQYTRDLVNEETNLGNMIENAFKEIQKDKENESNLDADDIEDDDIFEQQLFGDGSEKILTDKDFEDFAQYEEELELENERIYREMLGE